MLSMNSPEVQRSTEVIFAYNTVRAVNQSQQIESAHLSFAVSLNSAADLPAMYCDILCIDLSARSGTVGSVSLMQEQMYYLS